MATAQDVYDHLRAKHPEIAIGEYDEIPFVSDPIGRSVPMEALVNLELIYPQGPGLEIDGFCRLDGNITHFMHLVGRDAQAFLASWTNR